MAEKEEKRFRFLGEPLPLELANTVVGRRPDTTEDLLADPDDVLAWMDAEGLTTPDNPRLALEELVSLRDAVRATAEALIDGRRPSATALHRLNEVAARPPTTPILRYRKGRMDVLEYEREAPLDVALARIAREAVRLFGGPLASRLKKCEGPGCPMLFLAENSRRRWCSPRLCGNRVRVARHYERTRG
jgi:predicted RNA-binding Zn ribbon-like protein